MNDVLRCIHTINIEGNENNTLYIQKCTVHTTDCATLCYANEINDEKKTLSI